MEEQIAALVAEMEGLKAATAAMTRTTAETFYFLTIPLMVLIHAGFLSYEMGASRAKNALASGIKNILAFAFIIPTFYYAGWFIYQAFPTGLTMSAGPAGISGYEYAVAAASPVGPSMGPNVSDSITGVFFGAFAMFAATTASIMSGSLIERIKIIGFTILAIALGSFVWILGAAWGWLAGHWLWLSRLWRIGRRARDCGLFHAGCADQPWRTHRQVQRRWQRQQHSGPFDARDVGRADADHCRVLGLFDGLRHLPGRAMVLVDRDFRHDLWHACYAVCDDLQHPDGLCRGRDCRLGDDTRSILDDVRRAGRHHFGGGGA